jgi:cytoskeletal protein RodZ
MALPRPALLGILGALLILVTFVASHRLGKSDSSPSSTPAPLQASKPKPAPAQHKAAPTPAKHAAAKPVKHAAAAPAKPKAAAPSSAKTQTTSKQNVPAGQEAGASLGLPLPVAKAFAAHKVVVIFFRGAGADDTATAAAVRSFESGAGRGVAVFMDKLSNLADYRRVVEGLNVSQAPSIVVVDPSHKAKVLEGFIDAGSLRQFVADVAR